MNKTKAIMSFILVVAATITCTISGHAASRDVRQVKVVNDQAPDCSTVASMLA